MRAEIQQALSSTPDGVSEYTFSNMYLFRDRYRYHVSRSQSDVIFSGEREGKKFFMTPCVIPDEATIRTLFQTHHYWKNIPDSIVLPNREKLAQWGVEITEDRDNFDYLYKRIDLAELSGKKLHKKRNLVNAFLNAYNTPESRPLTPETVPSALKVLERWRADKGEEGDYAAAKEVLELYGELHLQGALYFINGNPVGWCIGEGLAQDTMFAVHFEKGIDEYKGIYQFINQNFAASLPEHFVYINREQDLGNEGLRQAKLTYRPVGFVQKYTGHLSVTV
jgi:hypothetical protein